MLKIENGRFSDCTFLEDLNGKNIIIKMFKNQEINWKGTIVSFSTNKHTCDVIVNENGRLVVYSLHNIESAEIF